MNPTITEHLIPTTVSDWTPGRGGKTPQYIVLHTTDASAASAEQTFLDGSRQASAHRIATLAGGILLMVSDGDTAWGAANWPVNEACFNLECEDNGDPNDAVRTTALYAAAAWQVADWCRRFGIPCKKVAVSTDAARLPEEPGIVLHKEVSLEGTDCPDGLDWSRIITEAQALLGGETTPVVAPEAASVGVVTPWGPGNVKITVQTLKVHTLPTLSSPGNVGNTRDGMLHYNQVATCNGWIRGDKYTIGDKVSDLWCHSEEGHYYAALGTDAPFLQDTPPVAPLTVAAPEAPTPPTPAPETTNPNEQAATPAWQSSYVAKAATEITTAAVVAHDFEGTSADRTIAPNTLLNIAGSFTVEGVLYLRTVWSATNGRWIGIAASSAKAYQGTPPSTPAPAAPSIDGITHVVTSTTAPGTSTYSVPTSTLPVSTSDKAVGGILGFIHKLIHPSQK